MILIDTGPLVAFFDASDRYHETCLDILKEMEEPLCTTWPVITESFYLLDFSYKAQDNLWQFLIRGGVEIANPEPVSWDRCRALMEKYQDLPMDLADASLVVVAEAKRIRRIFTLDHKDFSVYRPSHARRFELIPDKL
jgi:hypothetical protein